jgi:hypothetical protein
MRNRTGPCIFGAFRTLHARLVAAGLRPEIHCLDNECSTALKHFLTEVDINFQLVPPGLHCRNAAERAICTFKNHFIAGICSVDKNFPLHLLWDKLLPQAELTLNLRRDSRLNPKLSAFAQLRGLFDFNRTTLAPPGIRVLVHVKPNKRTTWSPHGADGWYTGPALDSYRCYTVWVWETRATRLCDTLSWFLTKTTMPLASSTDLIQLASRTSCELPRPLPRFALGASHGQSPRCPAPVHPSPHVACGGGTAPAARPHNVFPVASAPPAPNTRLRVEPAARTLTTADPPLRVASTPTLPRSLVPPLSPVPLTQRRVHCAPLPSATRDATFCNSTGARGQHRHRAQCTARTTLKPLAAAKTIHSNKLHSPPPVRACPSHHQWTRANTPLRHVAAAARSHLLKDAQSPSAPWHHSCAPPLQQHAFHGNTFNPDAGKIAEYRELRQCSEGPLWQGSNADEIGRLFPGIVNPRFSASSPLFAPKRPTPAMCAGLLAATKLTIPTMSAPSPPT